MIIGSIVDKLQVYLSLGWHILPCHATGSKAKAPLTPHGFKDASDDAAQVEAWAEKFPGCAWGVRTSAAVGVLDVDPRNGGSERLAALVERFGPLPPTPRVATGGGGFHFYFNFPVGTGCGKIGDGLDRKAEGGYVLVPPSAIAIPEHEGRSYRWECRPWEFAIADAPSWLFGSAENVPKNGAPLPTPITPDPWAFVADDDLTTHPGSPEGERRRTLCRLVGVHLARSDSPSTVMALADAWADRCAPPFEEWEKHVAGLLKKEATRRTTSSPPLPPLASAHEVPALGVGKEGRKSPAPVVPDHTSFLPSILSTTNDAQAVGKILPSFLPVVGKEVEDTSAQVEETGGGLTSFLPTGSASEGERGRLSSLKPEAHIGLLGDILTAIEPQLEGSVEPFAFCLLAAFGSAVGPGPHVAIGTGGKHRANISATVVAPSGVGKSEPWAVTSWLLEQADPEWYGSCVADGLGSGEGLTERVRDESRVMKWNKKSGVVEEEVIPGAREKRCLAVEAEFGKVLTLGRRDGSILGPTLCCAWDGKPLEVVNRGQNKLRATGHHVSIWGNITDAELNKRMGDSLEAVNGFGNRFLWLAQARTRYLPRGGDLSLLGPFVERLAVAIAKARDLGQVGWEDEAGRLWDEAYISLCKSQEALPCLGRARSQALRLTLLYALLDGSDLIRVEHVRAGLAAWAWAETSAKRIFGKSVGGPLEPTPEPSWLKVLNAIASAPGVKRMELVRKFRDLSADDLGAILATLEARGQAHRRMEPTGGRDAERWYPGRQDDGGGDEEDNSLSFPMPETGRKEVRVENEFAGVGREGRKEVSPDPSPLLPSFPPELVTDRKPMVSGEDVVLLRAEVEITDVTDAQETPSPKRRWTRAELAEMTDREWVETYNSFSYTANPNNLPPFVGPIPPPPEPWLTTAELTAMSDDEALAVDWFHKTPPPHPLDDERGDTSADAFNLFSDLRPGDVVRVVGHEDASTVSATWYRGPGRPALVRVDVPGAGVVLVPESDVERGRL